MSKVSKSDLTLFGTINLPSSKSISNRLLILKFLHPKRISISNLSSADDTVLLEKLLHLVGENLNTRSAKILRLNVGNSGTTMRFLTAMLSVTPGSYVLHGHPRMAERPVRVLVEALREMGADIQYLEKNGFLPLFIKGRNLLSNEIRVDASESSQHISALLLISTVLSGGLNIYMNRYAVSRPYIDMTCKILEICGFPAIWQEELIRVFPPKKTKADLTIEADWSSASFWYGMMALATEGEIFFPGLIRTGIQGDESVIDLFRLLGVNSVEAEDGLFISKGKPEKGLLEWDFRDSPDISVPTIVACAMAGRKVVFRGLGGLRIKESDRIESLRSELQKFNADLIPSSGGTWSLKPAKTKKKKVKLNAHADHRIAMAFMIPSMTGIEMEITDPEVVSKSYPGFWKDMQQLGFILKR
jgi:3-phosphoshikimate 1-carboxyvinyltransferase